MDLNARLQMFSIVSGEDNPDGIAYAAAAGDVNTMVKHLEKFPGEVQLCLGFHLIFAQTLKSAISA